MANQLSSLLQQWYSNRDNTEWVLGTVYKTEGPCYRKAGAMMLFNGLGQQFGLLSGGCLESDIQQHARRVMQTGKAMTLCYDGSDEDDLSFQLGIGCGGTVYILLQPVTAENNYLELSALYEALLARQSGTYLQRVSESDGVVASSFNHDPVMGNTVTLIEKKDGQWLRTPINPDPHLLIVGGGVDARPLARLAHELGWMVSLCDPRPANARRDFFPTVDHIVRDFELLEEFANSQRVDAAVLMAHHVTMDAEGLKKLQTVNLKYLAMLGPLSRQEKVLNAADLNLEDLRTPIAGPAGLNLGGELPESIALSILAECHARLFNRDAHSLSGVLTQ
ncbi:XdhC family protein [Porticoccaceae bacterium LTM1]|nr:XdhC family protein [Porticoccaceae bacterium LTM1]